MQPSGNTAFYCIIISLHFIYSIITPLIKFYGICNTVAVNKLTSFCGFAVRSENDKSEIKTHKLILD